MLSAGPLDTLQQSKAASLLACVAATLASRMLACELSMLLLAVVVELSLVFRKLI
jgi:hypothetical protein